MVSQWNEGRVAPFIKQKDNRGNHWKGKIANGQYPQPWKHTKDWADKRSILETQFCSLIASMNVRYTLAWRRPEAMHRAVGNTNKVLFIELLTHHLKRSATLAFFDDERMGFLGIKGVFVPANSRPAFDAGLIPSVDSKRQTATLAQIKTLIKIWHTAGFVERVLEGGALSYAFDQATFDRMRAQAQRAEEKRRAAKSPVHVTDLSASSELPKSEVATHAAARSSASSPLLLDLAPALLPPMMAARLDATGGAQSAEKASVQTRIQLPPLSMACGLAADRREAIDSPTGPTAAELPTELKGMAALLEAVAAAGAAAGCGAGGTRKRRAGEDGGDSDGEVARKAARRGEDHCVAQAEARLAMAEAASAKARAAAEAAEARAATALAEARAAEAEMRAAEAEARAAAAEARVLAAELRMDAERRHSLPIARNSFE